MAKEGWGVIRPGDRKAHYYIDAFSLCQKVGFYLGPLEPDSGPSPDDCARCRRQQDARATEKRPARGTRLMEDAEGNE